MEMYTNDLIDLADKFQSKEKEYRLKKGDYAVHDLLVDMQQEMRKILHDRLKECFDQVSEISRNEKRHINLDDLYKIINDL